MAAPMVQRVQQQTTFDSNNRPVTTYAVTFMVGEHGPFVISVPDSEFTAAKVQQKLATFAAEVNQLAPAQGS